MRCTSMSILVMFLRGISSLFLKPKDTALKAMQSCVRYNLAYKFQQGGLFKTNAYSPDALRPLFFLRVQAKVLKTSPDW